jgi:hypothetical protein
VALNFISSFIYFDVCSDNQVWLWNVNPNYFEAIDGISRIVKLIPEKLATAIEINQENLPDPKDDGSFLIVLVIDLLKFYQDLVHKRSLQNQEEAAKEANENFLYEEVKSHVKSETKPLSKTEFKPKPEQELEPEADISDLKKSLNLEQVLKIYSERLIFFKDTLGKRIQSQTKEAAKTVLTLAENLEKACTVYLDFLHPSFLQIKREGTIHDLAMDQMKIKVDEKIEKNNQKLMNEFQTITGLDLNDS